MRTVDRISLKLCTLHVDVSADCVTHSLHVLLMLVLLLGTIPAIELYEVKVGKFSSASNIYFRDRLS